MTQFALQCTQFEFNMAPVSLDLSDKHHAKTSQQPKTFTLYNKIICNYDWLTYIAVLSHAFLPQPFNFCFLLGGAGARQ